MKILVLGGTRYFGKHLVENLLEKGYDVTIATRGITKDSYGSSVERINLERTDESDLKSKLGQKYFDVVYDNIAYCSNDVKYVLETLNCERYIMVSSSSVYPLTWDIKEEMFQPENKDLVWCSRGIYSYGEGKRQAEAAVVNQYDGRNYVLVRFPFVWGKNDYTGRLRFYVEHVQKEKPMFIDNLDCQMSVISEEEAGDFLASLVESQCIGVVNACSDGTVSIKQVLEYVEEKTGKRAILNRSGEKAPFNEVEEYSLNTEKAKQAGYVFQNVREWLYDVLDAYIERKEQTDID